MKLIHSTLIHGNLFRVSHLRHEFHETEHSVLEKKRNVIGETSTVHLLPTQAHWNDNVSATLILHASK